MYIEHFDPYAKMCSCNWMVIAAGGEGPGQSGGEGGRTGGKGDCLGKLPPIYDLLCRRAPSDHIDSCYWQEMST